MPEQVAKYQEECQAHTQAKFAKYVWICLSEFLCRGFKLKAANSFILQDAGGRKGEGKGGVR